MRRCPEGQLSEILQSCVGRDITELFRGRPRNDHAVGEPHHGELLQECLPAQAWLAVLLQLEGTLDSHISSTNSSLRAKGSA